MNSLLKSKILIVEDEREIRDLISIILLRAGYAVDAVESAELARQNIEKETYDLLILDWMLPKESGIDLMDSIRKNHKSKGPSILLVTARAEPEDIVIGLDRGADDYVTKPFDSKVLVARVAALIRRSKVVEDINTDQISYSNLTADQKKIEVQLNGQVIDLTNTEFRLLWTLIANPDVVLTREKILTLIQGAEVNVIGRTVDTHLFSLRKKLIPWSDRIQTVRGVGYRFSPDLI